jgi:hypothetical protein
MRLLHITDIHGNRARAKKLYYKFGLKSFDIVAINGDITQFQGIDVAEEILSILSRLGREALFVPGNCDNPKLLEIEELGGARNIHLKTMDIKIDGLTYRVVGIGGSTVTPFRTWIEFKEESLYKMLPKVEGDFILVSHMPPYNTLLDRTWRGEHVGSEAIRRYILDNKPLLGLHGHIHESRGIDKIDGTIVINPGPLQNGYYSIIHIEGEREIDVDLERI